jgi:hypothetical protein
VSSPLTPHVGTSRIYSESTSRRARSRLRRRPDERARNRVATRIREAAPRRQRLDFRPNFRHPQPFRRPLAHRHAVTDRAGCAVIRDGKHVRSALEPRASVREQARTAARSKATLDAVRDVARELRDAEQRKVVARAVRVECAAIRARNLHQKRPQRNRPARRREAVWSVLVRIPLGYSSFAAVDGRGGKCHRT